MDFSYFTDDEFKCNVIKWKVALKNTKVFDRKTKM